MEKAYNQNEVVITGYLKTSASRKISVQYSKAFSELRMRGAESGGDCTEFSTIHKGNRRAVSLASSLNEQNASLEVTFSECRRWKDVEQFV